MLEAVNGIHADGASHAPLTPQTIRLDDAGQPHIPFSNRAYEKADTVAFGSAKYAAPEAFAGNDESSSCETVDCYVLGFIFYEILIGQRAFAAQFTSLENGPPLLWLKWHADKTTRARPLSELHPSLGHFARFIDGMTEKDPGKRIHSISRVLHAFSNAEAQTAHNINPLGRPAAASKLRLDLVRNKLVSAKGWLAKRLGAFRKPRILAGILLAVAIAVAALLMHGAARFRQTRGAIPAASPSTIRSSAQAPAPVLPSPPRLAQIQGQPHLVPGLETQGLISPIPESKSQVESHLRSGAAPVC